MQSLLILHRLPLCLSGITHPLTFSKEIADHDLRREAMKKHKSQGRRVSQADQQMGIQINLGRVIGDQEEEAENLRILLNILSFVSHMQQLPCGPCPAKAA